MDAPSNFDGISMLDRIAARENARKQRVPTEEDAFRIAHDCFERLKELGWHDIQYCPKDGTVFDAYCMGDLLSADCNYIGEWPDGGWWMLDPEDGDSFPCYPTLFRLKPAVKAE